ncbi:MAG: CPBP family intramembrane metalloprotease [Pseudoxanthomonas sp.]
MTLSALARQRPLTAFFVLAYAIAWLSWSPLALSRAGLSLLPVNGALWWTLPGSYAPLLSALIVQRLSHGDFRIAQLLPSWKHFCLGLAAGVALIVLGFLVLPGAWLGEGPLTALSWSALAAYPIATARALAMAGPLGEEPGWRGFALPKLQARFPPLAATLILGVLWAGWHLPLFLVPQWAGSPLWVYMLLVMGFCFVINLGFNLSRGSVVVAILLHAVFNASSGVLGRLLDGPTLDLSIRPDAVLAAGFALIALAIALAWLLRRDPAAATATRRA